MLKHKVEGAIIHIETDALEAKIRTEGYVSGIMAGSLIDKATGAKSLGFGLDIADFLLEPAQRGAKIAEGQYEFGPSNMFHGNIPKRYVEGPQICTQAKKLPYEIIPGDGFLAVKQWYTWNKAYGDYKSGSKWEQTIIFLEKERYFLSSDRVTTVNKTDGQFLRIDFPGHVKHDKGDTFEHVYLSYEGAYLPSTDFEYNAQPEEQYYYRRPTNRKPPSRMIRGYQVRQNGKPGPWLLGTVFNPGDVSEAWCHQRGYISFITEIGGWPTKPGDTFGAAYAIGWFDRVNDINAVADKYKGASGLQVAKNADGKASKFAGVPQDKLKPVDR